MFDAEFDSHMNEAFKSVFEGHEDHVGSRPTVNTITVAVGTNFTWKREIDTFLEYMKARGVQDIVTDKIHASKRKKKASIGMFKNCGIVLRIAGYECNVVAKVFFKSGLLHITGARSMSMIKDASKKIVTVLNAAVTSVKIQMINVSYAINKAIAMNDTFEALKQVFTDGKVVVMYDKDHHPGIKVVAQGEKGTTFIFRSGKFILSGFVDPDGFKTHTSRLLSALWSPAASHVLMDPEEAKEGVAEDQDFDATLDEIFN